MEAHRCGNRHFVPSLCFQAFKDGNRSLIADDILCGSDTCEYIEDLGAAMGRGSSVLPSLMSANAAKQSWFSPAKVFYLPIPNYVSDNESTPRLSQFPPN